MNKDSRVLVTGANGLAGSAAMNYFSKLGFTRVYPVTRQRVDLLDRDATLRFFAQVQPAYVFHAAALVYGLQGNMDNQGKSIFENTLINTHVIDASCEVGVKRIVAMGTNATYPWPPILPYREETIFDGRPHDGEAAYGHAKRHMLAMLEAYHASYGMAYTYLVSGNLYGPRDNFNTTTGHVLPSLIKKFYDARIGTNAAVSIWGDGSTKRDFLFSEDLADLVSFFMGNPFTGAINIGSGRTVSIEDVARWLSTISGVAYERVQYDTSKPKGRPECFSDLSKLNALGWQPNNSLLSGLEKTFKWYAASRN